MTTKETPAGRWDAPTPPDRHVPRAKLYAALDDAVRRRGVVCLQAPAGYGKTVSAALWLRGRGFRHAWLGLDPYDDAPLLFYRRLCAALAHLWPESDAPARALAAAGFAAAPVEHVMDAALSLPRLPQLPRDGRRVLVLDDLHLLRSPEVSGSLPFVLRRMSEGMTTLLLARGSAAAEMFRDALARSGKLEDEQTFERDVALIGPEALRFSRDEAAFCLAAHDREPAPGEADDVYGRTGGWPIAVAAYAAGRAHLSARDGADILALCIERQIWEPLDASAKKFLLRTSVAETLTGALCARLAGTTEDAASATLERIAAQSLLTTASGGGYVHHHLFRDFLRARLDEAASSGEIDREALYAEAAEHHLAAGELYPAMHFALLSRRDATVASALHEALRHEARNNSIAFHVSRIGAYFAGKIPGEMLDAHPYLYLTLVWYHHLIGDAETTFALIDRLYEALPGILAAHPELHVQAAIVCCFDCRNGRYGLLHIAEAVAPDASKSPEKGPQRFPTISKNLPFLHRGPEDIAGFPGMPWDTGTFRRALESFAGASYPSVEAAAQAGILYEMNRLPEALERAQRAAAALPPDPVPENFFFAHMIGAAVLDALERTAEARTKRAEIRAALEAMGGRFLFPNLDAYEARLRMQDGDPRAAQAWLDNYYVAAATASAAGSAPQRLELFRILQHLSTARALMLSDDPDPARAFLERVARLAADFRRTTDLAEALTLSAILEWHRGERKRAAPLLEEALRTVQPYGYVRVFADEGAAILPILKRISARIAQLGSGVRLDGAYVNEIRMAAFARSKTRRGIDAAMARKPVKLSKRQKLVLEHLAQGLGRREISARTGLSEENVKAHTAALYRALAVGNAMDAVVRARELKLIR